MADHTPKSLVHLLLISVQVPIFDVVAKNVGIIYDTGTGRLVHSSRLQMKLAITKEIGGAQSKELDMLRWCSATALELIGQAGKLLVHDCARSSSNFYSWLWV